MKIVNHLLDCAQLPSPNTGGTLSNPTLIVLHYTASGPGRSGDAKYFQSKAAKASAHTVVDRDGFTTQCVPFNVKAWHAGKSSWKGVNNCNDFSIGIEIDNWGILEKRADGKFYSYTGAVIPSSQVFVGPNKFGAGQYWEVYPQTQLDAVTAQCRALVATYPSIKEIRGHEDIAPKRKCDPGPALYRYMDKLNDLVFNEGRQ